MMATELLEKTIPDEEQEEFKDFFSTVLMLPKEDRAVLFSNANAFRVRRDIERAREENAVCV
ncbi:MAG: hypothetical protein HDR01_05835 [Lachnospiraceae bacterium]|nr:hypothetical protein [Lachnospiraceae bacterium]